MSELYKVRDYGKYTVVSFRTPTLVNSADVERVRADLIRLVEEEKKTHLVLDFTGVQFFSSQLIGVLLTMRKKLTTAPVAGTFTLCHVGPQLMELLKISRLERLITIKESCREAVSA